MLLPVAYYSQKITPLELNYNIYNKELLNIIIVLKKMESIFANIEKRFIVKTDYKNFTGFLIIKKPS